MARNEWQEFFDGHAPEYMGNPFVRNTAAEIEFLLELLALPPGSRIIDLGCGTGRHAVELAQRGYAVTGVDISAGMLAEARSAAAKAGVQVEWVQADIARYRPGAQRGFDAALSLCEGGFALLGSADDPLTHEAAILRNVHAALKPGGRFVLTTLNGLRAARRFTDQDVAQGRFDPLTMTEHSTMEWEGPEGRQSRRLRERFFVPTELALLLRTADFQVEHIWGGTAGNWGRRPVELDEMEIMAVARRP